MLSWCGGAPNRFGIFQPPAEGRPGLAGKIIAGPELFVKTRRGPEQAEEAKQAVFFSLLRKAIINAPLTVVLPIWMGTTGVFTAEAISQLVGGLACSLTMYFTVYRPLGRLPDRPPENI